MDYLYDLTIYTFPDGEDRVGYGVGLFRSQQEADNAASHYLNNVPGFRDYYCEAEVTRLTVVGSCDTDVVYRYVGWNVDENGDEVDVMESRCYAKREQALPDFELAQQDHPRQEWSLDPWKIGSLCWTEGFIREYPGGRIAQTMKDVRSALEAAIAPRKMVKVTFHYSDIDRYFFPLAVGKDLFLSAEEDDFLLDGFTVRRVRDVEAVELRGGVCTNIMAAEGWLDQIAVPEVDISNWQTVFTSVQRLGGNIIVEEEHLDGDSNFAIGSIQSVAETHVCLLRFDADGIWDAEPLEIPYAEITSVSFDTRYINVFSKYLHPKP